MLDPSVRAYDMKFFPQAWTGARIAMRVEATGCPGKSQLRLLEINFSGYMYV